LYNCLKEDIIMLRLLLVAAICRVFCQRVFNVLTSAKTGLLLLM